LAAMENMALWHERDISHSSVERVIGPDSTILLDYMLHRMALILKGLVVHPDRMAGNLGSMKGLIFSQQILLRLAEKGVERQEAYVMVQRNAMKVWDTGQEFKALVLADEEIRKHLGEKEIEEIFSLDYHLKYVDTLFERVFN
jgi:adenylosuccinate lyase